MTEYDYSPAAYERYMETQNRIAKWVDNTEAHHEAFREPFGPRSDVDEDDLDGMSSADEAIPSGASAGGWYEEKRRTGGRRNVAAPPPPIFYHSQPAAPTPMYPGALASAPVNYNYPPQGGYMSPQAMSPSVMNPPATAQIIIQTVPKHRSHRHHDSKRSSSSESHKPKLRTRTYVLPSPGSPMHMQSPSYGYPSVQPPPGSYSYAPHSAGPYSANPAYAPPPPPFSPPVSGHSMMSPSPSPSPYYPQTGGYLVIPPKGRHVRVMYA
ncbi:hypothetical protein J3R30DRAFT_3703965 [Lentinula aciculospora]|uniref:Uncharacterized protein n=1 Tax=Lentinula aciculospora TaxID=153920 RepID=A0A9W9DM97_9AGAR|nr:hypothetical protein J3R30DRAFT_3703965 [Lentinula aciculospora]